MNRDVAIEAGARAAFIEDAGNSATLAARAWDTERDDHAVKGYWRRVVAAALDAAAPHLVAEPVGYGYTGDGWQTVLRTDSYAHARARSIGSHERFVVALVPVEDQP